MQYIYLDNAATTCMFKELLEELSESQERLFGNASSVHIPGQEAAAAIEEARVITSGVLHTEPSNIYFTSGATEANNLILKGVIKANDIDIVITSNLEHDSVLEPLKYLEAEQKIKLLYVEHDLHTGEINYENLAYLLKTHAPKRTLASIMHTNNELGNINNIELITSICKRYNCLFHSDAVQSVGYNEVHPESMGIDFLSFSSHKIHGPTGIGIAYINDKYTCTSLIQGGRQEKGLRAGTQSAALIHLAAKALEKIYANSKAYNQKFKMLHDYTILKLKASGLKIRINGSHSQKTHKIISLSIQGKQNTDSLILNLNNYNICVSGGSACSSGAIGSSHVLESLNPDTKKNFATIRISFSIYNTTEEIDALILSLKKIYNEI